METLEKRIQEEPTLRRTMAVGAIRNGTVIDHIRPGAAVRLIHLLQLTEHSGAVTVGMSLPSTRLGTKDLIKVEGWVLGQQRASQMAILSPTATVNIISSYRVMEKYAVELPATLRGIAVCPNAACITNHEPAETEFSVSTFRKRIRLCCQHCEKAVFHDEVQHYRFEERL